MQSLLLFGILYLLFFAVGGAFVWYGCVLAKMKLTYPYTLPYDLPPMLIILLLFGGLLLIYKMFGSLAAIQKINRSDLHKITRSEYPTLFALIDEVPIAMRVKKPQHVYLSATATASIFLKTGFWNAFFSAKKNLEIGMGLIQFLNQEELRAVLAHEFGHFSRKSMQINGTVYAVGQSMQYLVKKVQLKKRGTFEDQYYIFAYLFRSLTDLLFTKLSKDFASFSIEMEYDADCLSAQYVGREALVSALLKSSFALQMFDRTLTNIGILAQSDKAVADFYTAQYYTAACFLQAKQIQWNNDFIADPFPNVPLSKLTKLRLEKLQLFSVSNLKEQQETINPAIRLFPQFNEKCHVFTQGIYQNQFIVNLSKLNNCSFLQYGKWVSKYYNQLETVQKSGQEVEIEIVLEKGLHKTPLTELFFYVYWDDKNVGKGQCRKGFTLKIQTSVGKHHLKIEGAYIKYLPIVITIENAHKHIIKLDYKHFLWKGEYRFSVKDVENIEKQQLYK